jgi:CheY-like chemotaxis protein
MGGKIELVSTPGQGSTFTVQLPFSKPAQTDALGLIPAPTFQAIDDEKNQPVVAISATAHTDGTPRYPVSVLVVDDHAMNRTFARLILEDCVQNIAEAIDGQQALQACQSQHYDLILLDLRMPGLDGLAVARRLREQDGPNQHTPIIAVTADVLREGASEWQAAGINDCLHKPLVAEQLESVIRHWCLNAHRNMTEPQLNKLSHVSQEYPDEPRL